MSRVDSRGLRVAFRVDASFDMGSGHVMRCLTMADALRAKGAQCAFICREHPGNLIEQVRSRGHVVHVLPIPEFKGSPPLAVADATMSGRSGYVSWLGADPMLDAEQCVAILRTGASDWLIVDHYALDAQWEASVKRYCGKVMVIDDLADRPHECDLLLDQTYSRQSTDYVSLVPPNCTLLCGSRYALLRPEFEALRTYSLQRRKDPTLRHLLVSMGGVDKFNITGEVLSAIQKTDLPADCRITVAMGASAPWLSEVSLLAACMPWPTSVRAGVSDMAQLMADSDLAIGAAGSTSWERCCLGLPTLMLVLADNQRDVARVLERAGAVQVLHGMEQLPERLSQSLRELAASPARRVVMSSIAAGIVDGSGVAAVFHHMEH